jgi:hypothetical protein
LGRMIIPFTRMNISELRYALHAKLTAYESSTVTLNKYIEER